MNSKICTHTHAPPNVLWFKQALYKLVWLYMYGKGSVCVLYVWAAGSALKSSKNFSKDLPGPAKLKWSVTNLFALNETETKTKDEVEDKAETETEARIHLGRVGPR